MQIKHLDHVLAALEAQLPKPDSSVPSPQPASEEAEEVPTAGVFDCQEEQSELHSLGGIRKRRPANSGLEEKDAALGKKRRKMGPGPRERNIESGKRQADPSPVRDEPGLEKGGKKGAKPLKRIKETSIRDPAVAASNPSQASVLLDPSAEDRAGPFRTTRQGKEY
jgi:hypothetical protein